jgi:hypothetical protein
VAQPLSDTERLVAWRWVHRTRPGEIERETGYNQNQVKKFISGRCRTLFPQLCDLHGDDYAEALRPILETYVLDHEKMELTRRMLEQHGQLNKLRRGLSNYGVGLAQLAGLHVKLKVYWDARVLGLHMNYGEALSKFGELEHRKRPKAIFAQIRSDHANCLMVVGQLDTAVDKAHEARCVFQEFRHTRPSLLTRPLPTHLLEHAGVAEPLPRPHRIKRDERASVERVPLHAIIGEIRALSEQQFVALFRGDSARCKELLDEAEGLLKELQNELLGGADRLPKELQTTLAVDHTSPPEVFLTDNYGASKMCRAYGWSLAVDGLVALAEERADDGRRQLQAASEQMQRSDRFAEAVDTDVFDFWWAFRDGLSIGGDWCRLQAAASAADVFVHLADPLSAHKHFVDNRRLLLEMEHNRAMRAMSFILRIGDWVRDLPPLVPFYSWVLDLQEGSPRVIDDDLARRVREMQNLQLHIWLPLAWISRGDFLQHLRRREVPKDGFVPTEEEIRRCYRAASEVAEKFEFKRLWELSELRLSKPWDLPGNSSVTRSQVLP